MFKGWFDIDRDAVEGDPVADADANGGDFVFASTAAIHPNANPAFPSFACDVERRQGSDDPFFEIMNIAPDVGGATLQIQHDIADALPRTVIGVLAAAPCYMHGEAVGIDEIARLSAGAG